MISRRAALAILSLALCISLAPTVATAQWVFVARKALGRIESMTQSPAAGAPRYDVATVILEAPADKVYAAILAGIAKHPDYTTVQRNDATYNVEVSNGKQSAGLHVVELQEKVSQLIIASVLPPTGESPTSFAVQNVLRVCAEMKVECSVESPP